MEFTDAPNLLVSQRDNNTIRYTLNGVRAWGRTDRLRIDVFDFRPTAYGDLGAEDDVNDPARRFSGVTGGSCCRDVGSANLGFTSIRSSGAVTMMSGHGAVGSARRPAIAPAR